MERQMIVAIDGYSSTGKSTMARALSKELGFIYVDTGSMYRAVTLYAMDNGLVQDGVLLSKELIAALPQLKVEFRYNEDLKRGEIYLNDTYVEDRIRSLEVSSYVSNVASLPEVRHKLVQQQRALGADGGLVMDGRDIGTVVFPNADIKFFMTASAEVRAKRRYKELIERGDQISYDKVLENVVQRDHIDSTRSDSPLRKAADAIEFDNSNMTIEEQLAEMLKIVNSKRA